MARDNLKIFDSDTHVGPFANVLEPYMTERDKKVLAEDFSLYLHAPCRSDASMAPAGQATHQT